MPGLGKLPQRLPYILGMLMLGVSLIPDHLLITYGCCTSSTRIILGSLAIGDGVALAAEES